MITFFTGPMFSGKTQELINIYNKYKYSNFKILIFSYTDKRYSDDDKVLCNFNQNVINQGVIKTTLLSNYYNSIKENDIIIIDEGQFFDDLVKTINFIKEQGKICYISYLNLQYNNKPFNNIDCLAYADVINIKKSICYNCKEEAGNTKLLMKDDIKLINNQLISIGGKDKYYPSCLKCLNL